MSLHKIKNASVSRGALNSRQELKVLWSVYFVLWAFVNEGGV